MISILQLGTIDYATGLRLQQQLVALRKEGKISDVLLLLEHSPVITLGRNAQAANIIASPELLKRRGVELFETNRGGDVTFHGPGQIVGYPIFDLRCFQTVEISDDHVGTAAPEACPERPEQGEGSRMGPVERSSTARKHLGAVDFVRCLEEVLIRTCVDFAIPTKRVHGLTGVWTDSPTNNHVGTAAPGCPVEQRSTAAVDNASDLCDEHTREGNDFSRAENAKDKAASAAAGPEAKLAAIGIHISRFVTSHGFALNVNADLSYFNLIVPCGITSKAVTSMQQQLGRALDLNAVAESISRNFGAVFQSQILWVDTLEALFGRAVGVPLQIPSELRRLHEPDDTAEA